MGSNDPYYGAGYPPPQPGYQPQYSPNPNQGGYAPPPPQHPYEQHQYGAPSPGYAPPQYGSPAPGPQYGGYAPLVSTKELSPDSRYADIHEALATLPATAS